MEELECRLCTGKECLIDTFASNYTNGPSMRSYILLATGVEIKDDDIVSTRVCKTCLNATFNMYLFRVKSAKNDELLKEKAGLQKALEDNSTPRTASIKLEDKACNDKNANFSRRAETAHVPTVRKISRNLFESNKRHSMYHNSVKRTYTLYPNIKLPKEVLNCDIAPRLVLKRCVDPTKMVPPIIISTGDISVVYVKRKAQDEIARETKLLKMQRPASVAATRFLEIYTCEYCPETFTNKKKMRRHEAQHRRDIRDMELQNNSLDQSLMVVSKTTKVYVCDICSEMFMNKKRLAHHIKEHNTCRYCKTVVTDLETHIQTCTNAIMSYNYKVNLVRCDKDPAILAKYAKAFESESSSSDGEDMTFMSNIFLCEKERSTIPSCHNSNNVVTFHNLGKDLANHCKIDVNLIPNPSKIKLEGSIAHEKSVIETKESFNFHDLTPITIQAPKTLENMPHLKQLMPISCAELQKIKTITNNNNGKLESVNFQVVKDSNQVLITKANGKTVKGCIVRVNKSANKQNPPCPKLYTPPPKDKMISSGAKRESVPSIFTPHAQPLLKLIIQNQAAGTSDAHNFNIAVKNNAISITNGVSATAITVGPPTITTTTTNSKANGAKPCMDFAKIRIKEPWEINGS